MLRPGHAAFADKKPPLTSVDGLTDEGLIAALFLLGTAWKQLYGFGEPIPDGTDDEPHQKLSEFLASFTDEIRYRKGERQEGILWDFLQEEAHPRTRTSVDNFRAPTIARKVLERHGLIEAVEAIAPHTQQKYNYSLAPSRRGDLEHLISASFFNRMDGDQLLAALFFLGSAWIHIHKSIDNPEMSLFLDGFLNEAKARLKDPNHHGATEILEKFITAYESNGGKTGTYLIAAARTALEEHKRLQDVHKIVPANESLERQLNFLQVIYSLPLSDARNILGQALTEEREIVGKAATNALLFLGGAQVLCALGRLPGFELITAIPGILFGIASAYWAHQVISRSSMINELDWEGEWVGWGTGWVDEKVAKRAGQRLANILNVDRFKCIFLWNNHLRPQAGTEIRCITEAGRDVKIVIVPDQPGIK